MFRADTNGSWVRRRAFKNLITAGLVALVLSLGLAAPVAAGPVEDAYARGDYATLRPLADQGHAIAQYLLGEIYEDGRGVPKDFAEAVTWYSKAADQGLARAQYDLARMLEAGKGVPQDFTAAMTGYRKRTTLRQWHGFARLPTRETPRLKTGSGWSIM